MSTAAPEKRVVEAGQGFAGQSVPRKEDDRLLQGQGVYFDDRRRHGAGYVHFVRSPYAHARIARIDVSKAEALDGVFGTLTGDEVAELTDPYFQLQLPPANEIKDYCMAVGKARYMGEPVVAVVAATRDLARDAAELVEVEYEPLGVNVDARRARDPDTPVMHDDAGGNLVWEGRFDWGDVDGALSAADRIVRIDELHFHRFSSTPIELCGAIAEYEPATGQFSLYCNHQFPGMALVFMAPALRVGMDRIRFVTHDIGGGFGNKVIMHTYLLICCLLARKLGRPVHWTEWRTDNHMANTHGNERWFQDIEVAVQDDGTIVGFRMKAIDDCGAYPRYEPIGCVVWSQVTTGCYRIRHVRVDFEQVCTNKSPCGPNRGYSRLQHLWFVERMLDIVGHELGIDAVEMRKRNYVRADEMPYTTVNGCVYDSGDYARSLDLALELVDYEEVRERQRRREPDDKLIGIGIGSTLDSGTNNFAQARLVNPQLPFSGNNEAATVKLDLFGEIVVTLGTAPQGQGHETTAAQVVADVLGVTPADVHVRPGFDSFHNSHVTFSGTYASQFAVTGLGAVKGATEKLANELRELAAWALGTTPDEILLEGGAAKVRGNPEAALTLMDCASIVNAANADLPDDMDVTLNCRHVYRPRFEPLDVDRRFGNLTLTYASQVHVCVVEIDPETGELEIADYAVVDDCGTRVNPRIVEGQVHGATAHAVGAALHEAFVYDDDGLLLTSNFLDYHAIHALEMPDVKTAEIESPSPFTPLGAKGLGEGGGGGLHAVAAAIQDALAQAGGGIVHDSFNNSERIYRLLHAPETSRSLVHLEA